MPEIGQTVEQIQQRLAALEAAVARMERAQTFYLGDHEALTRLYTGHRIYVDTRDVGICSHLMLEGRWEPWIETVIRDTIKPGMRFVDAGANFGYYTLLGAQWVGPSGKVHAFEANPNICRKLRKSVSVNGFDDRTTVHEVAVFSEVAELDFTVIHEYSGGGAIGHGTSSLWETHRLRVQAAPLDRLLAEEPSIDVMKIDVEGAEPDVIKGAAALLARSPQVTMIVEFAEQSIPATPGACAYLHGFLRDGFTLRLIEPAGLTAPMLPETCLARLNGQLGYLYLSR